MQAGRVSRNTWLCARNGYCRSFSAPPKFALVARRSPSQQLVLAISSHILVQRRSYDHRLIQFLMLVLLSLWHVNVDDRGVTSF